MFQPNPPAPRAMPDDQLNQKIAELQLQPDGLVAAMSLIEEQSRLRQEDALELSKWQLEQQMNAATEPAPVEPNMFQDPAEPMPPVVSPLPAESIQELPSTPLAEPEIEEAFPLASEPEPVEPMADPMPAFPNPTSSPERIEDIVAALNASYAEVATEPQSPQPPVVETSSVADPVLEQPIVAAEEQIFEPEPVAAAAAKTETETENEISLEKEVSSSEDELGPTQTGFALSWSWLAIAATPLALVVAAVIKDSGASLAQSVILLATVLFATSLLAAVGSMAAVRASSSLTIVSRAAFGVWGNSLPASLMLIAKLFWAAAFVYFASRVVSPLIFNQPWFSSLAERLIFPAEFTASLFVLIPLVLAGALLAAVGGQVVLRLQQATAIMTVIGLGTFVYFVASSYSLQDLSLGEAIAGPSLIDLGFFALALFGFVVLSFAGDFARKLPANTPGSKVFFLSFVSTFFLPLFTGVLGLLWLFMAGDTLGGSFTNEVLATVAASAPVWVFVVFVVAVGLSILYLVIASIYSLSGNLIGIAKIPGWVAALIGAVLVLTAVLVPSLLVAVSTLHETVLELVLLAGVVAAAWSGILISDALARSRGYHEVSLTREYGFYGRFNLPNTLGFIFAVALGFGYLNGGPQLSSWSGYLGDFTPAIFEIAGANIGIAMAFGLATLFPVVFGIPRIRKQERNLAELDQRRQELKEFLDAAQ
jgi:nucleobase:cation symporter-1, NCS1 family